jgi:hypothetical protein
MILLLLQNRGFRWLEAVVITLVATVGICFAAEIIFSRPDVVGIMQGFIPSSQIVTNSEMLYIAIGILGATVMPHNLYLHSSIAQTRNYERTSTGKREAIKFATIDSTIALMFALFINAAILIVAAAAFHSSGNTEVAEIGDAYKLLSPLLGVSGASTLFAVASGFGSKLDFDRNARRSNRDGRLFEYSHSSVAAASYYALDCNCSGGVRNILLRSFGNDATAHSQSSRPQYAVEFRRLSAGDVHERQIKNGRIRKSFVAQNSQLYCRRRYRRP